MKTLTVESVELHGFVSEELTEGKIAANGDRATPVFSPYSGRITRVIAGLGDTVKTGAPLATRRRARNSCRRKTILQSAAAQVKLARINETRKHALYDAKGGSLQDWQSGADRSDAPQNTALSAVRNRLTILGKSRRGNRRAGKKSDASIRSATLSAPIAGVVVDRQVGPGQYVQAGAATPAVHHRRYIERLAARQCARSGRRSRQPGPVRGSPCTRLSKARFKARVTYVSALVDPVTHRLPVRAEIGNRDGALKPEMFANFRILTSDASESPAVPQSCGGL